MSDNGNPIELKQRMFDDPSMLDSRIRPPLGLLDARDDRTLACLAVVPVICGW